eukprot:TRINITY_DN75880_c0_g1_i1.p1 TRINITY_DN75880_c0_g1~~TRINITY_DN75880_c0_g1_i1.p1  ORF type:complete len:672 (-),score=119.16 TRINITY_DN75880_c0_g1_i1:222-2237(-)
MRKVRAVAGTALTAIRSRQILLTRSRSSILYRACVALAIGGNWSSVGLGNSTLGLALAEETDSCPADGSGSEACRAAYAAERIAEASDEQIAADANEQVPEGIDEQIAADAVGQIAVGVDNQNEAGATDEIAVNDALPKADLITQEIDELRSFANICREQIRLLKELKELTSSGHNISIPETHMRMFNTKVPLLADLETDHEKASSATPDDFIISKATIPNDAEVNLIKFLPLRSPRSSSPSSTAQTALPSALLVAVQPDGITRLYTPSGELVLTFSTGHDFPVTHLTVSPSHDEYVVVTGDDAGFVRVHKVNVRQRRPAKQKRQMPHARLADEERTSQYLGLQVNVTAQFNKQMQYPSDDETSVPRLTALVMASQQGTRYFVTGDEAGRIRVFTKNGTMRADIDTAPSSGPGDGVEALHAHLSNLLYRTGDSWGFVDLERMEAKAVSCPRFEGQVRSAAVDSQQSARVLVADEAGTVWVFNVRNKQECKVEHRFGKGATKGELDFASVRGFLLGLERHQNKTAIFALNMSHVGKKKHQLGHIQSPVVWRMNRAPVRHWSVHKRYQQGDLMAFLSEDGHEIEIAELLMQVYTAPAPDSFGNFKLPVIAVAVVLVLGYQYMKQKGGSDDFSSFKSRSGGLGKLGSLKGRRGLGGGLGGGGFGGGGGLGGKRF